MTLRNFFLFPALIAAGLSALPANAQQAGLTKETWTGLPSGKSILILRDQGISTRAPNSTSVVGQAQLSGLTASSGTRLRGTITPLVTDSYTFWINGSSNVALWISEDGTRFDKERIAFNLEATTTTEWTKNPNQRSVPIQLQAGTSYHIEAHVMSGAANGHMAIAWRGQQGRYSLDLNGATATQSSTKWNKPASAAIDGNTSGVWGKDATTLTDNQANSWLQVDFGQDREINRVVLHNMSSSQNRLSNFRLSVLDANDAELIGQNYFTTSGNVGNSLTWDLPSSQPTARKIKVQLLGLNLAGNGNLALAEVEAFGVGLVTGQINHLEVIPSAYLTSVATDPNDSNDNNLPDDWEQQTGLAASALPGALLESGDPDMDGITNYQEHQFGSDPLSVESLADVITRSMWMDLSGNGSEGVISMTTFANRQRVLGTPNDISLVAGINANPGYKNYGVRYRGSFVAPSTGTYRFWIAGNGDAELWIADGTVLNPATSAPLTNRFGKQLLARSGTMTPIRDFDYTPGQRSRSVTLVQGQAYYIEVLNKQAQATVDHVSVAWQPPGQPRGIIPADAFLALAPDSNDADDDNLPDDWETAKTLNPANNGLTIPGDGEYGDADNDGLTNLQEFQNGTNPKAADSDGDGTSDYDEIFFYGSDPMVSNNLNPVTITLPQLNQYSAATGSWTTSANGSLTASGRRGGITYTFTVTEPGVHEVAVTAGAISNQPWYAKKLNLVLSLDADSPFASGTLISANGNADTLRALTPWLGVGTHTLTIFHDNVLAELRLRLDSVSISRLGGTDLDEDGVPDWVTSNEASNNKLTRVVTQSRTSPLSIEGIPRQLSSTTLTALMPGAQDPDEIPATESINQSFFADVPLSPDGAVTLAASFLGGVITESHAISWISTNLFEFDQSELNIRLGDSLRLDAWSGASADGQPFTVTMNGTLIEDGNQNTTHTSGVSVVAAFGAAGTYTLVATHDGQTATVILNVHAADFGPEHLVRVGQTRAWTPPVLGVGAIVENDDDLSFNESTGSGSRNFQVRTDQAANHHVIARLPAGIDGAPSAILARGTVHGFSTAQVEQTRDAQIVHRYDDGTWLMRSTIVATNLPAGVMIRITMLNQGSTFASGGITLELRAEDFDANGIAQIFYEYDGAGNPKLCHKVEIFIEG